VKSEQIKPVRGKKTKRSTDGTGNVFADLGIANPERELVKGRLALLIHRIIAARRLTQMQAAEILGVQQPQVSLLMRNRHGTFSVSRLIDFLTALGQDVQITVRATQKAKGELSIAHSHLRD